jgi:hypothetical protein
MGLATQKAKGPGAINEAEFNARKSKTARAVSRRL